MPKELSASVVLEYLKLVSGTFKRQDLQADLKVITPEGKNNLRVILHRLTESGVIVRTSLDGTYRKVESEKKPIDWQTADPNKFLPFLFPFGIHEYARIYPKSIIIVAGSKNEGKTSFLLECIKLNTTLGMPIDLYNSETGPEQLRQRLDPLGFPSPAPFNVYERYDNFADVIEPDHLSIIDYLDFNSEVYLVGTEIDLIFRKLTTGVAIIGLQKPPPSITYVKGVKKVIERDLAYGGGFTAKRAVLYISLSTRKLKLVYAKTPANPRFKPDNMMWSYEFDDSGFFCNINRYYGENQSE